jgi:hypothetical protein
VSLTQAFKYPKYPKFASKTPFEKNFGLPLKTQIMTPAKNLLVQTAKA